MLLRRIALGLAVTALVVVAALVLVAAVLDRPSPRPGGGGPERRVADGSPVAERVAEPVAERRGWSQVRVGEVTYAVPRAWSRRAAGERVAYREDGAVIASGRGQALLSVDGCPLAWAVVADPVRSSNVRGVAEATALAWARGYAGLPATARLRASPAVAPATERGEGGRAAQSRVLLDLGDGAGCGGERAELTAVAQQAGAEVVALVVARYLDVRGAPTDAAYDGVLGSLVVH